MTASATAASTEISLVVVLLAAGCVTSWPIPGVVTFTASLRAIGSEPAMVTESISFRASEVMESVPAESCRYLPSVALASTSTMEIAADAPTPTDVPELLSLSLTGLPFLSAEAVAVVYTFCAARARITASPLTMMSLGTEEVLESMEASVSPSTSAMAAEPATPTLAAPTPEMAEVEIRQPMPSSSPGLPNFAASDSAMTSSMAAAVTLPLSANWLNRSLMEESGEPSTMFRMNSGSVSVSKKSFTVGSINPERRAFAVSPRWPLVSWSVSCLMMSCLRESFWAAVSAA